MKMKILYIGDLNTYGRGYYRLLALQSLGHDVVSRSHTKVSPFGKIDKPTFMFRVFSKLRIPQDDMRVNREILKLSQQSHFDIIWIEKGNMIWPWTLWLLRQRTMNTKIISCSEDDMYATHGHSLWYRLGLKFYDVVFTTKVYNLQELKKFGARKTCLFLDSFSELIHKSIALTSEEVARYSCEVSAISVQFVHSR